LIPLGILGSAYLATNLCRQPDLPHMQVYKECELMLLLNVTSKELEEARKARSGERENREVLELLDRKIKELRFEFEILHSTVHSQIQQKVSGNARSSKG
jgi:hypothetical protein